MRFKVRNFVFVMLFFVGAMGRARAETGANPVDSEISGSEQKSAHAVPVGSEDPAIRKKVAPPDEQGQCEEDQEVEGQLKDLQSEADRYGSNLPPGERASLEKSVEKVVSDLRELRCDTNPADNDWGLEILENFRDLVDGLKALPTDSPGGTSKAPVVASSVPSTPGSGESSFAFKVSSPQGDVSVSADSGGISYPSVTTVAAAQKPTAQTEQRITPRPRAAFELLTHTPSST